MYQAGYKLRNFFSFFLKRLARLEPPYMFSIILALMILFLRTWILTDSDPIQSLDGKQIGLHLFYLVPFFNEYQWLNEVYWTLAIEFQYYIFIALSYVLIMNGKLLARVMFYFLCVISTLIKEETFLPFWLPVFLLGILTFLYKVKRINRNEFSLVFLGSIIVSVYIYPLESLFYSLLPVILVLKWPHIKVQFLDQTGKFSYSIYLIHPLLGASLINILSHYCSRTIEKCVVIFIGLIVTYLGASLMGKFIEEPSKLLSSRIKY